MNKRAKLTSVWDGGEIRLTVDCWVNPNTHEITDISWAEISGVNILEEEIITIDGVEYEAYNVYVNKAHKPEDYWYIPYPCEPDNNI